MDISLFKRLLNEELISEAEFENIEQKQKGPISVHWELTTLLYIGILLFTGGLGILVYKNIDTLGHTVIILTIAALCLLCFTYCFKTSPGYSKLKVEAPNAYGDYVLILGCLLLLTFIGYLQFEYQTFGTKWGLATFIPMVILFVAAYYFDHVGVLSMAITNLAAWAGISAAPLRIIRSNDFSNQQLIYTALILGSGLLAISYLSNEQKIKAHFAYTYKNFGTHILFISLLAGLFHFYNFFLLWFLFLAAVVFLAFKQAAKENSFYFLVIAVLYGYIGLSYVVCRLLFLTGDGSGAMYLGFLYFIASGLGLIKLLIHYNHVIKKDADL